VEAAAGQGGSSVASMAGYLRVVYSLRGEVKGQGGVISMQGVKGSSNHGLLSSKAGQQ
jgi:hypothetical protein